MNLLLAVIFSNYKQHLEVEQKQKKNHRFLIIVGFCFQEEQALNHQRQLDSLLIAFERLTTKQTSARINYETYCRLMVAMNANIFLNSTNRDQVELLLILLILGNLFVFVWQR